MSCDFNTQSSQITRTSDYQNSLKASVSWNGSSLWNAAFSANAQYHEVESTIDSATSVFVSAGSTCQTYIAQFQAFTPINVTKEFRNGVAQMPLTFDNSTSPFFLKFFQAFGTSYASKISMGATASFMSMLSSQSYSSLQSGGVAGAKLSFLAKFGFNAQSSSHYSDYQAFQSAVSSAYAVGVGAAPPLSSNLSNWDAWQQEVTASNSTFPMPMSYTLESLDTLLISSIFPQDQQIAAKQAALTMALKKYCGQLLTDCGAPPPPANKTIGWKMFGFDASHSHRSPYVGASTNNLQWQHATGGQIDSSPAIGPDGTVYIGSNDHNLYAINATGTLKWKFPTGSAVEITVGADGTIYFGSYNNNLYAIDAAGTLKWKFATGGAAHSSPAIGADGTIYIGSVDNNLYAINAAGTLVWKFATGNEVESPPAIGADGTVCVGSYDGSVYSIKDI